MHSFQVSGQMMPPGVAYNVEDGQVVGMVIEDRVAYLAYHQKLIDNVHVFEQSEAKMNAFRAQEEAHKQSQEK